MFTVTNGNLKAKDVITGPFGGAIASCEVIGTLESKHHAQVDLGVNAIAHQVFGPVIDLADLPAGWRVLRASKVVFKAV